METSARNKQPAPPASFHVLIAAAGTGTRLGGSLPKQYQNLGEKTVLRHTIDRFYSCKNLASLCVIIDPSHTSWFEQSVMGLDSVRFCYGGKERNISIYNGIKGLSNVKDEDIILIHDAARPFISPYAIQQVADAARDSGAASLALPVADTLYRPEDASYPGRAGLWALQTPQGFAYGLIRHAHETADPAGTYTDDTSLVAAAGHDVVLVPGNRNNFKITTPQDWEAAQAMMTGAPRTGFGFDVHAFDMSGQRMGTVRLCGIDIPHPRGLAGHSDADVGLHALTDALLGAIAAGDIGQHFPPSDPEWKNKDSAHFLAYAAALVRRAGARIENLDLTLICEAPKVGPHREVMQRRVAEICGLSPSRVGIKATTTERLGFTGRGEGIAAQAVATVTMIAGPDACNEQQCFL